MREALAYIAALAFVFFTAPLLLSAMLAHRPQLDCPSRVSVIAGCAPR